MTIRKSVTGLAAAGLLGLAGAANAYTIADLGLTAPFDFQIKFNNYELLNADTSVNSGFTNTDGLYLGDNFGIFQVTSIQDAQGTTPVWTAAAPGNTIPRLTGVFWGFDIYNVDPNGSTAKASGGYIALFANPTFDVAIREQGPGAMIGSGSTTIDGFDFPTYTGITDGTLLLAAQYQSGCDALDPNATLCAPTFLNIFGSFLGAAKGYAEVDPTLGELGAHFDTGSLATDTPGVFRDISLQSNFTPPSLSGCVAPTCTTNWPVWSFDPVFGRTVPEPATVGLIGLGLLGVAGVSRRKKAKA